MNKLLSNANLYPKTNKLSFILNDERVYVELPEDREEDHWQEFKSNKTDFELNLYVDDMSNKMRLSVYDVKPHESYDVMTLVNPISTSVRVR